MAIQWHSADSVATGYDPLSEFAPEAPRRSAGTREVIIEGVPSATRLPSESTTSHGLVLMEVMALAAVASAAYVATALLLTR